MTAPSHFAAQYIRMSTNKQDLSPSLQKEAIAAYAAARGMEIVASYEAEGTQRNPSEKSAGACEVAA